MIANHSDFDILVVLILEDPADHQEVEPEGAAEAKATEEEDVEHY